MQTARHITNSWQIQLCNNKNIIYEHVNNCKFIFDGIITYCPVSFYNIIRYLSIHVILHLKSAKKHSHKSGTRHVIKIHNSWSGDDCFFLSSFQRDNSITDEIYYTENNMITKLTTNEAIQKRWNNNLKRILTVGQIHNKAKKKHTADSVTALPI